MPALKTEITEIITGLALLGDASLEQALRSHPPATLRNVDEETWTRLCVAHQARSHEQDFLAAWNNGRAFLNAQEGLRGRPPQLVEWKGRHRDPGDHAVPADLRIDHVYLVSCKYLSKVLHNASPWALFERLLGGSQGIRSDGDWFDEVAPAEHQLLYQTVRSSYAADLDLPQAVRALSKSQRNELRLRIPKDWSAESAGAYAQLVVSTAERSATRWTEGLGSDRLRSTMLWRLLRLAPAAYFVLGTGPTESVRLRVGTPWDFAQAFRVRSFVLAVQPGGQARVGWTAEVTEIESGQERIVAGHVEIRWSHGRFAAPPEAKVYLDTPHHRVPGYWPLQ
ncbi:MAG: hypothetical protein WCJ04_03515 [Actinomycetes bacterium]